MTHRRLHPATHLLMLCLWLSSIEARLTWHPCWAGPCPPHVNRTSVESIGDRSSRAIEFTVTSSEAFRGATGDPGRSYELLTFARPDPTKILTQYVGQTLHCRRLCRAPAPTAIPFHCQALTGPVPRSALINWSRPGQGHGHRHCRRPGVNIGGEPDGGMRTLAESWSLIRYCSHSPSSRWTGR